MPALIKRTLEPIEDINFSKIAIKYSNVLSKDMVQTCLKHLLSEIGNKLASGCTISIDFGFGKLKAKARTVSFVFGAGGYSMLETASRETGPSLSQHTGKTIDEPVVVREVIRDEPQAEAPSMRQLSLSETPDTKSEDGTFQSVVLKDAYQRHLSQLESAKKEEKALDVFTQRRRYDSHLWGIFCFLELTGIILIGDNWIKRPSTL